MWENLTNLVWMSQGLLFDLVMSMMVAIVFGLGIGFIYRYTNRGLSSESSFLTTLVLLAPIVTIVMFFIQGDLVVSLGLVGSLSIVRFRTPIKDTRDMVFIFWTIATGLGAGTLNSGIVIVANVIIAIVMILLYYFRYGISSSAHYVLVLSGGDSEAIKDVNNIINHHNLTAHVRSHEAREGVWERVLEIQLTKSHTDNLDDLVNELTELSGMNKVSLLAPQLTLPM